MGILNKNKSFNLFKQMPIYIYFLLINFLFFYNVNAENYFYGKEIYPFKVNNNTNYKVFSTDIDSDSDTDIVVFGDDKIKLFFNNGTGVFNSGYELDAKNGSNLIIRDINQDGKNDLLLIDKNTDTLYIYLNNINNGNISFNLKEIPLIQGSLVFDVKDINGDGNLELVLAGNSSDKQGYLKIFNIDLNTDSISEIYTHDTYANAIKIITADYDGDKKEDVILIYKDIIKLFQNNISGTTIDFIPSNLNSKIVNTHKEQIKNAIVADIENDGLNIIAYSNNYIELFSYQSGNFSSVVKNVATGNLVIEDILSDEKKEIILNNHIYFWDENLSNIDGYKDINLSFSTIGELCIADIDKDNNKEFVYISSKGLTVSKINTIPYEISTSQTYIALYSNVSINSNSENFMVNYESYSYPNLHKIVKNSKTNYLEFPPFGTINSYISEKISFTDIDNDGNDDILFRYGNSLKYMLYDATTGSFGSISNINESSSFRILKADIDGDDINEIILIKDMERNVEIYKYDNTTNELTKSLSHTIKDTSFTGNKIGLITDFDKDGDLDIVLFDDNATKILVLLTSKDSNGNLGFTEKDISINNLPIINFAIEDINKDGKNDIVILTNKELDIFLDNQSGSYSQNTLLTFIGLDNQSFYNFIKVDDFDKDGNLDIAYVVNDNGDLKLETILIKDVDANSTIDFNDIQNSPKIKYSFGKNINVFISDIDNNSYHDVIINYPSYFTIYPDFFKNLKKHYTVKFRIDYKDANGDILPADGGYFPTNNPLLYIIEDTYKNTIQTGDSLSIYDLINNINISSKMYREYSLESWGDDCASCLNTQTCQININKDLTCSAVYKTKSKYNINSGFLVLDDSISSSNVSSIANFDAITTITNTSISPDCYETYKYGYLNNYKSYPYYKCSFDIFENEKIILDISNIHEGYALSKWDGDCATYCNTNSQTCEINYSDISGDSTCFAVIEPIKIDLNILDGGLGSVVATSNSTIDCQKNGLLEAPSGICSESFNTATTITLKATPADGYSILAWGGDCSSCGNNSTCSINVNKTISCNIDFGYPDLNISISGDGKILNSSGNEICYSYQDCQIRYNIGAEETLQAVANEGYTFDSWGGDCSSCGNNPTCSITLNSDMYCTAKFVSIPTYTVYIDKTNYGSIVDKDTNTEICSSHESSCQKKFPQNSTITLYAKDYQYYDNSFYAFDSWGGDCSSCGNNPTCSITLNSDMYCTAKFNLSAPYEFELKLIGNGKVIDEINGTDYDAEVSVDNEMNILYESYYHIKVGQGKTINLKAVANEGYTFDSWGGDCSSCGATPTCSITFDTKKSCIATFKPYNSIIISGIKNYSLSINKNNNSLNNVCKEQEVYKNDMNFIAYICSIPYTKDDEISIELTPNSDKFAVKSWNKDCDKYCEGNKCNIKITDELIGSYLQCEPHLVEKSLLDKTPKLNGQELSLDNAEEINPNASGCSMGTSKNDLSFILLIIVLMSIYLKQIIQRKRSCINE